MTYITPAVKGKPVPRSRTRRVDPRPRLRKDKQEKHEALCAIVEELVQTNGYVFEEYTWAPPLSQSGWPKCWVYLYELLGG